MQPLKINWGTIMELLCIEEYRDIRFTLQPGDTTALVPYLDDDFKKSLLADFPEKFKPVKATELVIEGKEEKLAKKIVKK